MCIRARACGLFFGSLAGYADGKLQFKGRNILFTICLSSMMIPFQVTMIKLIRFQMVLYPSKVMVPMNRFTGYFMI